MLDDPDLVKRLEEAGLPVTEENIFIVGTCDEKGLEFLKGNKPMGIRYKEAPKAAPKGDGAYTANVDGKNVVVKVNAAGDAYTATVNGKTFNVKVSEGAAAASAASTAGRPGCSCRSSLCLLVQEILAGLSMHRRGGGQSGIHEAGRGERRWPASAKSCGGR